MRKIEPIYPLQHLGGNLSCGVVMTVSPVFSALLAVGALLSAGCLQQTAQAQNAEAAGSASVPSETAQPGSTEPPTQETAVIDHDVIAIDGQTVSLSSYRGQVMLIVNTASECGFTPQLGGLQELHQRFSERGFSVLGFPCNDFGGQDPGTREEIQTFCNSQFGVSFPLFDKVTITGGSPSPLYETLQNQTSDGISGAVRWNFTKFLVDTEGRVVARFEPNVTPDSPELVAAIEALLPR
jgi:glutathione peroxidase